MFVYYVIMAMKTRPKKKNKEEKLGIKNNEAGKLRLRCKLTTFNLKATYKGKTSDT